MNVTVSVTSLEDLVDVAGVELAPLAQFFGVDVSYVSLKVRGLRPWFVDEVPRLVLALRTLGKRRVQVSVKQAVELIGGNIKGKRHKRGDAGKPNVAVRKGVKRGTAAAD